MHGIMDLVHKSVSPKTYPCKLCLITFSGATMNKLWKRYVSDLGIPSVFMHRNEFEKAYPEQKIKFPAVLLKTGGLFKIILSAGDFKKLKDIEDLVEMLNKELPHGGSNK